MTSTRDLDDLPGIPDLKNLCQSLALLDAIFLQGDEHGYQFDAHWGPGEQMASLVDGFGNEYYILFTPDGAIIKGFDHESKMTSYRCSPPAPWPGVLDHAPSVFAPFLIDPRFRIQDISFCIWRTSEDSSWRAGPIAFPDGQDPDGSEWLLSAFVGTPLDLTHDYIERVEEEELSIPLDFAEHVFRHEPMTAGVLAMLGADTTLQSLQADLWRIDYPSVR